MNDDPPLTLALPRTRTLDGLLQQLDEALQADHHPLGGPRMSQLVREVVAADGPDSFSPHLGFALDHPGEPVHPFCMLALYEDFLPRVGREMGLVTGHGLPPERWLPSDMPRTRQIAAGWQRYAHVVLGELDRAMRVRSTHFSH